jgi:hypothetical protein
LNKKQRKRKAKAAKAKAAIHFHPSPGEVPEAPHSQPNAGAQPSEENSEKSETTVKKEPTSNWFLVAFTAALVVTGLLQWDAIKSQISSDERRFAMGQRPYIWFVSEKPILNVGQPISWNLDFENDGHSTAFKLHLCAVMLIRKTSEPAPLDERFKADVPAPSFSKCLKRANDENRSVTPPGGKGVMPVVGWVLSQSDVDFIKSNTFMGALIIEGISEYDDGVGNHYTTTFCDMYSPFTVNIQCPYYNDMR